MNKFERVNNILLDSLDRLVSIDTNDVEQAKIEIARSNAISQTSKALLSGVAIQLAIVRTQERTGQDLRKAIESADM